MADGEYVYCPRCGTKLPEAPVSEESDCSCGWVRDDPPRLVVAAIVELGDTLVLVRNRSWPETWYGLVAGHLHSGETPVACALRKVKEEVGLGGEVVEIVGVYPNFPRNQIVLVYHVRAHGRIVAGPEIAGVKQQPVDMVRLGPLATGQAVHDWIRMRREREPPSEA